jgi:hypothetical protein
MAPKNKREAASEHWILSKGCNLNTTLQCNDKSLNHKRKTPNNLMQGPDETFEISLSKPPKQRTLTRGDSCLDFAALPDKASLRASLPDLVSSGVGASISAGKIVLLEKGATFSALGPSPTLDSVK